jgi:hypothetical protein
MYIPLPWRNQAHPAQSHRPTQAFQAKREALVKVCAPGSRLLSDALVSVLFPADCRICSELLVNSRRVPICPKGLASFEQILSTAV